MNLFSPNLNVRNERKTKPETIKAQTDAENPYKIKETSKNIANGDAKKMHTAAGNPSKMNSSQRRLTNKNRPPKAALSELPGKATQVENSKHVNTQTTNIQMRITQTVRHCEIPSSTQI